MKLLKNIFTLFALCVVATCMAQEVTYYLPNTEVSLVIQYDEITLVRGEFYQYAERYLGTKDVITESGTRYELTGARVVVNRVADSSNPLRFVPGQNGLISFKLTKDGILEGLNLPEEQVAPEKKKSADSKKQTTVGQTMPLMEDQLMAASVAKMAEGAAKQIFRIREARMNLLAGDVDKAPADGRSTDLILKEMKAQEEQLVALFTGKTIRTHATRVCPISYTGEDLNEEVAFRFSNMLGVLPTDDLAGTPYFVTIKATARIEAPSPSGKQPAASAIYYVVPGEAEAIITDGNKELSKRQLLLRQLGYTTYLPLDLIKTQPVIRFGRAGQLLSIDK